MNEPAAIPDAVPRIMLPLVGDPRAAAEAPPAQQRGLEPPVYEFQRQLGNNVDLFTCSRWIRRNRRANRVMNFFPIYTHSHANFQVQERVVVKRVTRFNGLREHKVMQYVNDDGNRAPNGGHHHVVPCLDALDAPLDDLVWIVMPFLYDGRNLSDVRANERFARDANFLHVFRNVVENVQHLHGRNICHGYLRPENVAIDTDSLRTTLIDMKMCLRIPEGGERIGAAHAPLMQGDFDPYFPPEIYYRRSFDGFKVDVWSLGILLFFLLTNETPFLFPGDDRFYRVFWSQEEADENGYCLLRAKATVVGFLMEMGDEEAQRLAIAVDTIPPNVWNGLLTVMLDEDIDQRCNLAHVIATLNTMLGQGA